MRRPRVSRSLQTMVNMDNAEWREFVGFGESDQKVQQDGGVEAARKGNMPGRGVAPRGKGLQEFGD
jgi:hypothetical protein